MPHNKRTRGKTVNRRTAPDAATATEGRDRLSNVAAAKPFDFSKIGTSSLPLIPLRDVVVFPFMVTPLFVSRPKSIAALEQALLRDDRLVVLAAQRDPDCEHPEKKDLHEIATLAEVMQMLKLPDGTAKVLVEGACRIEIKEMTNKKDYCQVKVIAKEETSQDDLNTRALVRLAIEKFEQYVKSTRKINPESLLAISGIAEPGRLADIIATYLSLDVPERQKCLEISDAGKRLEYVSQLLSRELELSELEQQIHDRVRFNLEKTQREYYLREKMRIIQEELAPDGQPLDEIAEYKQKIASAQMSELAEEKAEKELQRLEKMMPQSAESSVIRTYLDTLIGMPWAQRSQEVIDLRRSSKMLEEDHHGLSKVKERILEYLAVRKLAQKPLGTILCLVGPPGVGKTSLARSIARSMNRKFARISLGGVNDEAEIRGHRRTYIGAMPGRIMQAIKQTETCNPVILLDEIEKMSHSYMGDPTAAMLEVLDPDQNEHFCDHYLDTPYSLREVVFIATANSLDYLPRPLYDRLEVIRISGYTEEEKCVIAAGYVIPKTLEKHGLSSKDCKISNEVVVKIIRDYTREAGVRSLSRHIAAICRKVAAQIVKSGKKSIVIKADKLSVYLGPPRIWHEVDIGKANVGMVTGLAWTESGGETLPIEVNLMPGKGNLQLTGQLGEVMKESAQAAFSYIRSHAEKLGIAPNFQESLDIHIHLPEGAIPKDGPSAGAAMALALISAITECEVRGDIAMTGEITLRGRVLAIGGLKEKVLAAVRAGVKVVLYPQQNQKDLIEIPKYIYKKVSLVPVSHLDEVLKIAFGKTATKGSKLCKEPKKDSKKSIKKAAKKAPKRTLKKKSPAKRRKSA